MKRTVLKIFLVIFMILLFLIIDINKLYASFYNWNEALEEIKFRKANLTLKSGGEEEASILPYYIKEINPVISPPTPSIASSFLYYSLACEEEVSWTEMSFALINSLEEKTPLDIHGHGNEPGETEECLEPHATLNLPGPQPDFATFCFPSSVMEEGRYTIAFYYDEKLLYTHSFTFVEEECIPDPIWIEGKAVKQTVEQVEIEEEEEELEYTCFSFQTRFISEESMESFNLLLKDREGVEISTVLLGENFDDNHICVPTEIALCEKIHISVDEDEFYIENNLYGYNITVKIPSELITNPYTLEFYLSDTLILEEILQLEEYPDQPTVTDPSPAIVNKSIAPATVTWTLTAKEGETITLTAEQVQKEFNISPIPSSGAITVAGSGTNEVTISIANVNGLGFLGVTIQEGTVTDSAGNVTTLNITSPLCTVDTYLPFISPTGYTISKDSAKEGDVVTITVGFNEAIEDGTPKISMSGVATLEATAMTRLAAGLYRYDYTVPAGNGIQTITISDATDLAGNIMESVTKTFVIEDSSEGPIFTIDIEPFANIDQENKLIQIPTGVTISHIIEHLETESEEEILFLNQDEEELEDDILIGTGMLLKIGDSIYTFIIPGDVDGDANFTVVDLAKLKLHMLDLIPLEGAYLYAADVNRSGENILEPVIDIIDLSFLKLSMLDLISSSKIKTDFLLPEITITTNTDGTITITATDETEIDYITYKWNEETETKITQRDETKKKIELTIPVLVDENLLTIVAYDKAENTKQVKQSIIGVVEPE